MLDEIYYASLSAHCGEAENFSHQENEARTIGSQHRVYVDVFVQSGLNNPTFCKELEKILPSSR